MTFIFISLLGALKASGSEDIIQILDKETKEPIHSATITITSKDQKKMIKADKYGKFVNPFPYPISVQITCVGYLRFSYKLKSNPGKIFLVPTTKYMNPIVTTGQFTPRSTQKSVYPVKVISSETISEQAANDLRELLNTESNIRMSQDGVLGSSMSINGISGENIKILIDGVPVIGRMDGNIDLSQINLSNIDRVEIIEGPMSSVYGSDALGGVINLISKDQTTPGTKMNAETYYESVGRVNANAGFNYYDETYKTGLNFGRNFFNGYSEKDYLRAEEWSPKEQYFADFNASMKKGNHTIKYQASYFDEYILKRYEPYDFYKERAFDDRFYTDRFTNSLFYNAKVNENTYLTATANYSFYQRIRNKFSINRTTLDEILVTDKGSQDTSKFNTYIFRSTLSSDKLSDYLAYQLGLDFQYDDATGQKIEGNRQEIGDYAVFGGVQITPLDEITVQPTFRYSYNTKYDSPLTYTFNLKYNIINNLIFRATYGKGFRAPSLKELY
jgi:outer membrane receptor for ferrienterochelin and colicins